MTTMHRRDYDGESLRDAYEDCAHDFVSMNNRFISPFDSGLRCRKCGLEVDEDEGDEEDNDEEDSISSDFLFDVDIDNDNEDT